MKVRLDGSPEEIAAFFKSFSSPQVAPAATPAVIPDTPPSKNATVADGGLTPPKPRPTRRPRRGIGFVQEPLREAEQDEGGAERASEVTTERKIMNYLVDHDGADLKDIAQEIGMSRSDVQERLAFMEQQKWVRSQPEGNSLRFFYNPIRRANQVVRSAPRHVDILEVINTHPGSTNREIGCRILMSTEDVSSTTGARNNLNRLWTRTGTGQPEDPFRYFPVSGEEMAEGQPS